MNNETGTADRRAGGSADVTDRPFVVGRDMGPVARWFRIVFALIAAGSLWYRVDKALDARGVAMMAVWLLVVAAVYTAVIWFVGRIERFRGASPWIGSALLWMPMILYPMDLGPGSLHQALAVYTTIGILICGLTRYSGLEVAALSMLLLRRRTVLYSPFNTADVIEQAFRRADRGPIWAISLAVTVFCFVEYWMVALLLTMPPAKDLFGESILLPGVWAVLMAVPTVHFAVLALRARRDPDGPGYRIPALAAASSLVLVPMLADRQVPDALWGIIMAVGVVVGLVTLVRLAVRAGSPSGDRKVKVAAS